jgi:CBS domain-containing protein
MSVTERASAQRQSCRADDHLQRAAEIMSESDSSVVSVVDGEGEVVGVITARDICMAAYRRCLPLWHMDVRSAMTSSPPSSRAPISETRIVSTPAHVTPRLVAG